jgi:2-polyprenyl-6-methoxyphenol hydroxylase-like FAD-dependent oxidoreductase
MHYRCRMLVAADGTPSRLARLAGIGVHNRRISIIVGYRIRTDNLPEAEFGHVYLGAETPVLLYPIGGGQARVLFDIPYEPGRRATAADCLSMAQVLPQALRREVEDAIATQPRMSLLTQAITPEQSVNGRVVLVGDAGGSCHPLTATGMTMCVRDALTLRAALQRSADDWPAALQLYQRRRRWPQTTRLVLADALREAFCAARPDLRVVRGGILRHLRASAAGRAATLALLSTADARLLALLRQFATVMVRGFMAHLRDPLPGDRIGRLRVATALVAGLTGHLRDVLCGPRIARGSAPPAKRVPAQRAACAPDSLPDADAAKASQPVQP